MDDVRSHECVILVHGLARRKSSMEVLGEALRTKGYNVVNWDYLSTRQGVDESADALYACYELNKPFNRRIHLVTHSLGGIVVRAMLKKHDAPKLGRIAMIAPPNQGSAMARMLFGGPLKWFAGPAGQALQSAEQLDALCAVPRVPTLIVAGTKSNDARNPASWISKNVYDGPNDGTVSVAETRLPGIDDPLQIDESHTFIPENRKTIEAVIGFVGERLNNDAPIASDTSRLQTVTRDDERVRRVLESASAPPNIKMKTWGGNVWWADLLCVAGWRVQENVLLGNCRLLDPRNVRRAWGPRDDILKLFQALTVESSR